MFRSFLIHVVVFFLTGCLAQACQDAPTATMPVSTPSETQKPGWTMIFHDEFASASLDQNVWATKLKWGDTNPPELEYYASDAFDLSNGILHIQAKKQPAFGQEYRSGVIASFRSFSFQYGYLEARVRVPSGQGLWPALWLLYDGNKSDEIDAMEILGDKPDIVYMTLHYDGPSGHSQNTGSYYTGSDFSKDFHIFAVDWSPNAIIWYVDGVERFRVTNNIPQGPLYIIANLAIGGKWPGAPNNSTNFPAYFDIDYIRVYKHN
jgi:beta-glucanase (GH16 family)